MICSEKERESRLLAIKQLKCNCGNEQYKQGDWGTDDNVYSCVQYADTAHDWPLVVTLKGQRNLRTLKGHFHFSGFPGFNLPALLIWGFGGQFI